MNTAPVPEFLRSDARRLSQAAERACLAKAKPERTVDATGAPFYSTNCGDLIYVFNKSGASWTLSDLSPND